MLKRFALATAALALSATAAQAESTLAFTGVSVTQDSYYTYLGGLTAVNRDLGKDGFLIRAVGGYGGYTYDRTFSTDVDGNVAAGDVMVGYQTFVPASNGFKGGRFTVYIGGDYQDHDLSPNDALNSVNGSEFGLKGQVEASINLVDKVKLDVMGSYSGAYNNYWSKAQLGYNVKGINVGPEVAFLGSESYDQQRYGAFVKDIPLFQSLSLGASAGYEASARRGKDGGYGEVGLSLTF